MAEQNLAIEVTVSWAGNPLATTVAQSDVVIGPSGGAWFLLPIGANHTLLERSDVGWTLRVPDAATSIAMRDGRGVAIEGGALAMSAGTVAEVTLDAFTFYLRATSPEVAPVARAGFDWRAARWVGAAMLLHGALLGIFAMSPPDASALNLDPDHQSTRYLQIHMDARERPEPPASPAASASPVPSPSTSESGARGGGDSETVALPGGGNATRRGGRPRPTYIAPNPTEVGVLAALRGGDALSFDNTSSPYTAASANEGPGGPGAGFDLRLPGGPDWGGGLDMRNRGHGTCDPTRERCEEGTIAARLETDGNVPSRIPALRGHRDRVPPIPTPVTETFGALQPEQVRRVIRRHIAEVRFCYEQSLQSRPDLEGRVAIRFVIAPGGSVQMSAVAENSVDARVGSCVNDAVRRWTFPQAASPTGVTYPFVMQSGS